jgi:hypothetical protein
MTDFEHPLIKGKNLEELINGLVDKESGMPTAVPGSVMHELTKAAIQAKMVERLAAPKRWAAAAAVAAIVSALAAVVSAIAAF